MPDELRVRIDHAIRGEFTVLAELASTPELTTLLAATLLDPDRLALLQLRPPAEALEVVSTLEQADPITGAVCWSCDSTRASWTDPCPRCGASADTVAPDADGHSTSLADVVSSVRDVAVGTYEVFGALPRTEGKGALFFGRECDGGRMIALGLLRDPACEPELRLAPLWLQPSAAESSRLVALGQPRDAASETELVAAAQDNPPPDGVEAVGIAVPGARTRWKLFVPALLLVLVLSIGAALYARFALWPTAARRELPASRQSVGTHSPAPARQS